MNTKHQIPNQLQSTLMHKKVYSCEYCTFETEEKESLISHNKENHDLSCKLCETKFVTKSSLEKHIKFKHEKNENSVETEIYGCKECDYKSTQKLDLITHINKTHEKKVCCDPCKNNTQENSCINCTKKYCKPCVAVVNPKATMDNIKRKGLIENHLKSDKFLCKECFKKRCIKRNPSLANDVPKNNVLKNC